MTAQRRDARRRRKEVRQRQRLPLVFPLPFFAKAAPFLAALPQRKVKEESDWKAKADSSWR